MHSVRPIILLTRIPPGDGTGGGERSKSIYIALKLLAPVVVVWLRSATDDVLNPTECIVIDIPQHSWITGRIKNYSGSEFRTNSMVIDIFRKVCSELKPSLIFCRYLDCVQLTPWKFAPSVIDVDDIPWELPIRSNHKLYHAYNVVRPYLYRRLLRHFKTAFVTKTSDLAKMGDVNRMVLPCISTQKVVDAVSSDGKRLLFVGNLLHGPNIAGLAWFVKTVWPNIRREEPEARLLIAGKYSERCVPSEGISILGFVKEIELAYHQAPIVICPIHAGTGATVKLAEAALAGKAIVSTTRAACGYTGILRPNIDLLIADDPLQFTIACLDLLRDVDLRRRLAASAAAQAELYLSQKHINQIVSAELSAMIFPMPASSH